MDELKILQKTYDMMQYLHQTLQQYPKSEKYGLAADTKSAAQGVEFCGFRIWPTKVKLKKKTALRMRRAVNGIRGKKLRGDALRESAVAALRSYWGLTTHVSGDGLKSIVEGAMNECLTTKSGI